SLSPVPWTDAVVLILSVLIPVSNPGASGLPAAHCRRLRFDGLSWRRSHGQVESPASIEVTESTAGIATACHAAGGPPAGGSTRGRCRRGRGRDVRTRRRCVTSSGCGRLACREGRRGPVRDREGFRRADAGRPQVPDELVRGESSGTRAWRLSLLSP